VYSNKSECSLHMKLKKLSSPRCYPPGQNTLFSKCGSYFCAKSNFSNFDRVYNKMYQHMRHQFSFIKFTIKYVLISHIFSIMGVNIFLFKFGQSYKSVRTIFWTGASTWFGYAIALMRPLTTMSSKNTWFINLCHYWSTFQICSYDFMFLS